MVVSGFEFDEDVLDVLFECSEGWVVGLCFWLLVCGDLEEQVSFGVYGVDELICDYLLEEVIEWQLFEVQVFFVQIVCFECFCVEFCDIVCEVGDSVVIFDYLQQYQVFFVLLDENGQWFCYYYLFFDLLLVCFLFDFGLFVGFLYLCVCGWFSCYGLFDQVVEQVLCVGQLDVVVSLVQNLLEE